MTDKLYKEWFKFFFLGFVVAMGMVFLMGARGLNINDDLLLLSSSNRYQIAAWGDAKAHGAFVMDSITGQTKVAYRYIREVEVDKVVEEKSNLNTKFTEMEDE